MLNRHTKEHRKPDKNMSQLLCFLIDFYNFIFSKTDINTLQKKQNI